MLAYLGCALFLVFSEGVPIARLIPLSFIVFVPPVAVVLSITPTLICSIYIEDDWVEQRLFNRWVISRARASTFIAMEPPAMFPAALVFANGNKIRLFGGTLAILRGLESELVRRRLEAELSSPE